MDRAPLELLLGRGLSLADIGRRLGVHESTVSYWLRRHGLGAVNRDRSAARGGLARAQLQALAQTGMSIAQIAEAVDRSKATVRHWLTRYQLKTHSAGPRRSSRVMLTRQPDAELVLAGPVEFVAIAATCERCIFIISIRRSSGTNSMPRVLRCP